MLISWNTLFKTKKTRKPLQGIKNERSHKGIAIKAQYKK